LICIYIGKAVQAYFQGVSTLTETQSFALRLRQSLEDSGVSTSPTVVANEFNLRYWGRSITSHTARNWLLGKAIPTQDKLRVLAEWLQVSPDALRFGQPHASLQVSEHSMSEQGLNMVDKEQMIRYLALPMADKKTVRDVTTALTLARPVKT
jgi:transcriptional regulator with XRE-family HTH domain